MIEAEEKKGLDHSLRDVMDRSESGAPSAGKAVADLFSTDEIFHRITATADEEFSRSERLLFLSGLAAGLSMGLSFVATASLTAAVPGEAAQAVGNLLYPLGFIVIAMGRYQLFTENTLTPVTLVMTRIASLPVLLRIWGIVLLANVLGAGLCAYVLATTGVFDPGTAVVARSFGAHFLEMSWTALFWKGVFAGWLIASMVWLNHAARNATARMLVVFILIYTVAAADLAHCIVGSSEVLYLVFEGGATLLDFFWSFLVPATLGNTVGGVLLVAILNYAQTRDLRFPDRDCGQLQLTWREWLLGRHVGREHVMSNGDGTVLKEAAAGGSDRAAQLNPPVNEQDHVLGNAEAPVTLVQFGDYECPTSRQVYLLAQRVMHRMDDNIRYVYRHLPLRQDHPHAERAAAAAEAAARQDRFWDMHDRLFQHQEQLGEDELLEHAQALELDVQQFTDDLQREKVLSIVSENRRSGIESRVRRTSNLFINGERYEGEMEVPFVEQAVKRKLSEGQRSVDQGQSTFDAVP